MNCKNCGAPLSEGAQFCKRCGTAVTDAKAPSKKPRTLRQLWENVKRSRAVLLPIAAGVLLLLLALILVISVVSCSRAKLKTPEAVGDAVVAALQKGDGDTLYELSRTSVPFLGQHTEQFGEGDTPETVMRQYYRTLADTLHQRLKETYGKRFTITSDLTVTLVSDTAVFEPNRALEIEAEQYAILTGPLSVSGTDEGTLRLVAAKLNNEWKLLIVYLY